jgi:threonine/homoserine/homoserine lactone efflux protein
LAKHFFHNAWDYRMFTAEFLVTSLIVVLVPGTGVVYTVSTRLALGRRASLFAALGCTLGIVPQLPARVLGSAEFR